jgi:hypothetical protein
MRTRAITILFLGLVATLAAAGSGEATVDGTVKLGGTILDEEGDLSAVQETYNVYDGFSLTQIRLNGTLAPQHTFLLDLREINLGSRKGDLVYRMPGMLKLTAAYDQNRHVFSPDRGVNAERRDWRLGARFTPVRWLGLSGQLAHRTRTGDRLSFPAGVVSALGTRYDNALRTGRLTAELRKDRIGGAVTYRASGFRDERNPEADRTGHVVSARLYAPCRLYDKWTHMIRGAYGVRRLSERDLDYTLANFQYTGAVEPLEAFHFRYHFDANRIDDQSTGLQTDRFRNDFDATYVHAYGRVSGGYGYETNDDDRTLTSSHTWRAGASLRLQKYLSAKLDYASRTRKDPEDLTLLQDVEASRTRAGIQLQPRERFTVGADYSRRERELPDINVRVDGDGFSAFARYTEPGWGAVSADYSFSTDDYQNLAGEFCTESHIVTGRVEFDRIRDLRLAGGLTYLDIGRDLDIEKSVLFLEAGYTLQDDYHLEVRYNVYNYDDYILLDRYYTANVVRINIGYDLHLE